MSTVFQSWETKSSRDLWYLMHTVANTVCLKNVKRVNVCYVFYHNNKKIPSCITALFIIVQTETTQMPISGRVDKRTLVSQWNTVQQ